MCDMLFLWRWTLLLCFDVLPTFAERHPLNLSDVRNIVRENIEDFKLRLHQKLEELTILRQPLLQARPNLQPVFMHSRLHVIESSDAVDEGCVTEVDGSEIAFVITSNNALMVLRNSTFVFLHSFLRHQQLISLQAMKYNDVLLTVHYTDEKNSHVIEINNINSDSINPVQKINLAGPSISSSSKVGYVLYLAVISVNALFNEFRLFVRAGMQFDEVFSTRLTEKCFDLATWTIDGTVFFALGFPEVRKLEVKSFVKKSSEMQTIQALDIEARVVKHFEYSGSHYLVCGTSDSLIIYWWTGSTFRRHQTLVIGTSSKDILIHTLSGKIVIAIALHDEVLFLFRHESHEFVKFGSINFRPVSSLKRILLWNRGRFLQMLPIFEENRPLSLHQIGIGYEMSDFEMKPHLRDCIELIYGNLYERQKGISELTSKIRKVWSSSSNFRMPPLKVNGKISTYGKIGARFVLETNVTSPLNLNERAKATINRVKKLQKYLTKIVFKSRTQLLKGNLVFGELHVNDVTIEQLKSHVKINEMETSHLPRSLKLKGDQTFWRSVNMTNLSCIKSTTEQLNGNRIEDYVLLNSDFAHLTGQSIFGNVSSKTVFVNGRINGLEVDSFILTSKEQDIYGLKMFKKLAAESIQTPLVNEVHLDEIKELVLSNYLNGLSFNFKSDTIINGNLNISSLNGYNVTSLFSNTVKRYGDNQHIFGNKHFNSMIVDSSATVTGKINNYALDNFMTINTNQMIYNDTVFPQIIAFRNIYTELLNGIDLSHQAVMRSGHIFIEGVKSFEKNLNVSFITMKDGVVINSFDPSVEGSSMILKSYQDDFPENYFFSSATMKNLNVTNLNVDINNFPLLKNIGNVWLRTIEQNIPYLETTDMRVSKLHVSRVNDVAIEDILTVNGNATIHGSTHFVDKVTITTLSSGEEADLNFSPELRNQKSKVKVLNNVTIENAVLEKDLLLMGTMKNFESGFLHRKNSQTVKGKMAFDTIQAKRLISKDLKVHLLNKRNFTAFLKNAVRKCCLANRSIHNKHFKSLTGSNMHDEALDTFLDKVVTTNTQQKINAPLKFLKPPSFKNIIASTFFEKIRLSDVVYKDEVGNISNKHFIKSISTTHLNSSGNINGLNITHLQLTAFFKNRVNIIEEKLAFHGNFASKEIQVVDSKIDDVNLDDVIRLNRSTELESLNASDITVQNIKVTGRINGCYQLSVLENMFTNPDFLNINVETKSRSLMIDGNLMLHYLNGAKIPDWISLMNFSSSPDIEGNLEFEYLKVENLNLLENVNNVSVDFVLKDAVLKTSDTIILGNKYFQEISVKDLSVPEVTSKNVCGINTTEIFKLCVSKDSQNLAMRNAAFGSLISKRIKIKGNLNSLNLLTDVVFSNKSEIIEGKVIIINTLKAITGISVHGKIDGVNLEALIKERITLSTAQNLTAKLNFTEDAVLKGKTLISGTVNDIRIEDVVNKSQSRPVAGIKTFSGSLRVETDLIVNGSINGVSLEEFLWKSRNESMKEVQFSALNATSLICRTINGLNVIDFYNYTHDAVHEIDDKLHNFTADQQSFNVSLMIQEDMIERPISLLFNYFELHEFIKFGPVKRFLPVYKYGTIGEKHEYDDRQVTQMVMWIEDLNACRNTESLIADVSSNAALNITKKMKGKMYLFSLQKAKEDVVGVHVQAEHSRRCLPGTEKFLITKAFYSTGDVKESKIISPAHATLLDIQLLELDEIFLVVAYNMKDSGERIFVYYYDAIDEKWSFHQQFHEQNLTSLNFIKVEEDALSLQDPPMVYLSVTGDRENPGITVYEWDFDNDEFFLKTFTSTAVSSNSLWLYEHGKLYLLLSKEKTEIQKKQTKVAVYNEPLEVYTFEEELTLEHTVNIKGVNSLERFALTGEAFVLASSNHMEIVYVLQLRGYNGFQVIQEIPALGVTETRVFTVGTNFYLVLNSVTAPSRILKASVRKGRFDLTRPLLMLDHI